MVGNGIVKLTSLSMLPNFLNSELFWR
uniref:Uncharacterized protein n=1 Tax=Rhizophora mucronata TaxID=61149 RepID=A0A2P2QCR0_RHIMU